MDGRVPFQLLTPYSQAVDGGVLSQLLTPISETIVSGVPSQLLVPIFETMDSGVWFQISFSQLASPSHQCVFTQAYKMSLSDKEVIPNPVFHKRIVLFGVFSYTTSFKGSRFFPSNTHHYPDHCQVLEILPVQVLYFSKVTSIFTKGSLDSNVKSWTVLKDAKKKVLSKDKWTLNLLKIRGL